MKFKSKKAAMAEVDMTPMIDIVFQLIAFFMVITNFEQTQADERVKLPRDVLAKPADAPRDNELTLNVGFLRDERGNKLGDGQPLVFYLGTGENVPVLSFGRYLKLEYQNYKDTGVDPKDVTVVIRADREVPTGMVQSLIKMSQEAGPQGGFEKFALKATEKSQD